QSHGKEIHERPEDLLEDEFDGHVATRDVAWNRYHRTAHIEAFLVLARQVCADDLASRVGGREIDGHPGQAADRNLAQRHPDRLRIEIAFLVEILVETTSGETRVGHDLIDRDRIEAMAVEHDLGAADDPFPGALTMFRWIGHGTSQYEPNNFPRSPGNVLQQRVRGAPPRGSGAAAVQHPGGT